MLTNRTPFPWVYRVFSKRYLLAFRFPTVVLVCLSCVFCPHYSPSPPLYLVLTLMPTPTPLHPHPHPTTPLCLPFHHHHLGELVFVIIIYEWPRKAPPFILRLLHSSYYNSERGYNRKFLGTAKTILLSICASVSKISH